MTETAAPARPRVEAIDFQRNGSDGTSFYTAIVNDKVDGRPGRFLVQFASSDRQRAEISGIAEDRQGDTIAFVTDLDAAHAGDLSHGFRGLQLTARWLPLLEQARKDKDAADNAQREAENIERRARTRATVEDALPRIGLPLTEENIAAGLRSVFPGRRRIEDDKLEHFRITVEDHLRRAQAAKV